MNELKRICVIVEGKTEQNFVNHILTPYCLSRGINMCPHPLIKTGQNGGDVKFSRAKRDILASLKAKDTPLVCTFFDYYGIKEWPGRDEIPSNPTPQQIADTLNNRAIDRIKQLAPNLHHHYIPFLAVHEFESLLFSDSSILAEHLKIDKKLIDDVLSQCGSPEQVNNGKRTAPSKRIKTWKPSYNKLIHGLKIAAAIGIPKMRQACPLFDQWLTRLGVID